MDGYGYGLWVLVVVNSAVFIIFAASFFHPSSGRDWRALGGFSAFIVALFAEMYGYPLTIYLASSALGDKLPLSHDGGHLWSDLIGWPYDPHLSPFHLVSYLLIGAGFWLISVAWQRLVAAQRAGLLATSGVYARIRHPQYAGFLLIMTGFLLQWPTLVTGLMYPVLVIAYRRLAISEEREVRERFGAAWDAYALATPRFIPHRRPQATRPPRSDATTLA